MNYGPTIQQQHGDLQEALNYLAMASDLGKTFRYSSGLSALYAPARFATSHHRASIHHICLVVLPASCFGRGAGYPLPPGMLSMCIIHFILKVACLDLAKLSRVVTIYPLIGCV